MLYFNIFVYVSYLITNVDQDTATLNKKGKRAKVDYLILIKKAKT